MKEKYNQAWYSQVWEDDDGKFSYYVTQGKIDEAEPTLLAYGEADSAAQAHEEIARAYREVFG